MLQLLNRTPLSAALVTLADPDGVDALHVVVQATFALRPDAPLVREQRVVALADERVGDGPGARLRRPSVVHPAKPRCELLIEGEVVAPGQTPAQVVDAAVVVGQFQRNARAFGDRQYTGDPRAMWSDPAAFIRMPITPDRAYGGTYPVTGEIDPRNPAGRGFVPRDHRDVRGISLPNLEDPSGLIGHPGDHVSPVLFGPVEATWSPRRERAGTYDAAWDRTRAPFLPRDFDPLFVMSADASMWLPERLRGGERIAMWNLADDPVIEGSVAYFGVTVRVRFRGRTVVIPAESETLHLFPGEGVATLAWRAVLRCGHRVLDIASVEITAEAMQ